MLTPDQARERLNQARDSEWNNKALKLVAGLPEPARGVAWFVLNRDLEGRARRELDRDALAALQTEVADRFDATTASDRHLLWSAIFPRLDGDLLEKSWQSLVQWPYQSGWARKPFRAPHDASITRARRLNWFQTLTQRLAQYNPDLDWLSAWLGHADPYWSEGVVLLAAAIDAGGPRGQLVLQTLRDSASGTHEIGVMGHHVIRSLLSSASGEAWEFVEKLLLAAQRQEGLRQSILEAIDEGHPAAFRRMLRVILEHDLARFSATVRAFNTWFGFGWDSVSVKVVNDTIDRVLRFLDDAEARATAIASGAAEDAYLALWSIGYEDAIAAIDAAAGLLDDGDTGRRFVAVHLLCQLGLPARVLPHLMRAYDDEDLRIALRADLGLSELTGRPAGDSGLFESVEGLLVRVPAKPRPLEPIVWPWQIVQADRRQVCRTLLNSIGSRPPTRLVKYLPLMEPWHRSHIIDLLIKAAPDERETRDLLLKLAADPSPTVRTTAMKGLAKLRLDSDEATRLESLLSRKSEDLRQGVLTLLLNQADAQSIASADRLLAATRPEPRRAGLELLRRLAEANRCAGDCRSRAAAYGDRRRQIDPDEDRQVKAILDIGRKVPTLDDALGLLDPAERTRPVPPVRRDQTWLTAAAFRCLRSLATFIHEHRETPVSLEAVTGQKREELLGNLQWGFPQPNISVPIEQDQLRLPLRELWESWWAARPADLIDPDGLELIRAWGLSMIPGDGPTQAEAAERWGVSLELLKQIRAEHGGQGLSDLPYPRMRMSLMPWLLRFHPVEGAVDFLLDGIETGFSKIPPDVLTRTMKAHPHAPTQDWRSHGTPAYTLWLNITQFYRALCPQVWTGAQNVRLFRLLRWMDEPGTAVPRSRPSLSVVLAAFEAGGATKADLFDHLLGPIDETFHARHELQRISGRKAAVECQSYPVLREIVDRCRERILEVELDRGEAPTAASAPALAIRSLTGASTLLRLLHAMRDTAFNRRVAYWSQDVSRSSVFSHLIRVTFPAEGDTPEAFAAEVKRQAIAAERLVELAAFAPQWARFVEQALRWPQLEEAVWWLHAHTKGNDWTVDPELREAWAAEVAARTALSAADLVDGAVDVDWFHRAYKGLGPKRWPQHDEAAKFVSSGAGHTRARLFASAMAGQTKKTELLARIKTSRHSDSLRALGLLPMARGASRERDLLDRYKKVQEFVRTSKQFGAMRQANEKRAAAIAMDNLARTAGYPDPIRLEWAMEARSIADLAQGPVSVVADGVTVSLAIDGQGQPELSVKRGEKPLKSVPPAVKKQKKIAELVERVADLKRQSSRVRQSLEAAMCRGDAFTGDELKQLTGHAVLSPLLSRLVLIGEGIAGYPAEHGQALRDHAGHLEPVKPGESLRIAHPHDLLGLGDWHLWQRECFAVERVQPFKQVFRELYVLTEAERTEPTRSLRYAGHQVNPRQALALLGSRGWVNHPEEGVRRTFHETGLTAELGFLGGVFTPAEVEGLTIEDVQFVRRGEWKPLALTDVPSRLFSEVMRDLDLVVSVAHRGGVDPEASASTVEMRANLLRETCELLGIGNIRVQGSHALIDGELGHYSLHMGSAVVHRQPGGALCIVPVHAQHRGRLFLPFADDDPRTAEVLSKALLLARDREIQDPTILVQIRTAH
jgi:hypothetical protein